MRIELDNSYLVKEKEAFITINKNGAYEITISENTNTYLDLRILSKCDLTINLLENSTVEILSVDTASNVYQKINVAKNAQINGIIGHFSVGEISNVINLNDYHATCELKMVSMANMDMKQMVHASVNHNYSDTKGIVKAYCVTNNNGEIIFDGVNKINKGNARSESSLHIRGMILSDTSMIAANPALLIDEYDVKANHGATIGKISDEGLYYLMSRGISKTEATMLIVNGFLIPIIENINNDDSKEYFKELSQNKI